MRLDQFLFAHGYAASRQKAKDMITAGSICVGGICVCKPSHETPEDAEITVTGEVLPYVGRGGYKLEAALDAFGLSPAGFSCVDIGASTGGFTDCLLMRGARHVTAVDSGSGQLAEALRRDPRVTNLEKQNARQMDAQLVGGPVSLAVCDVSFISLRYIFEPVTRILLPYRKDTGEGSFVSLIKPQFEAGREAVGKNGIVRDAKVHLRVVSDVIAKAAAYQLYCVDVIPSPIKGGDGNREFLAHFAYRAPEAMNLSLTDSRFLAEKIR